MLADTLTLPQVGGDIVLTKIKEQDYSSEFVKLNTLDEYRIRVRHQKMSATAARPYIADRHNVEVVQTVYAVGAVPQFERKFYYVIETKPGDVATNLADAVCDLNIATSDAFLTKVANWES
jgi:hypothetical protein